MYINAFSLLIIYCLFLVNHDLIFNAKRSYVAVSFYFCRFVSYKHCIWFLHQARAGEYISSLKGSVLSSLLDAGVLFLLRFSLDDSVEGVMSAAVHALRALLVSSDDEVRDNHLAYRLYTFATRSYK